jgi:hypothetical protein
MQLKDIATAQEYQRKKSGKKLLIAELRALKEKEAKVVLDEIRYPCVSATSPYYKHDFRLIDFEQNCF